jgi:maltokinase
MSIEELLAHWLPQQRWYGGKGTTIRGVSVRSENTLHDDVLAADGGDVRHLLLDVSSDDGSTEIYQLLLGRRPELSDRLEAGRVGEVDGLVVYDALHDPAATAALLRRLVGGGEGGGVRFSAVRDDLDADLPSRVIGAEQSNTSVVYGDDYILKVFRRVQAGTNPDLEVTRALADAGSSHVAAPLAWLEADVDGRPTTLGMMQCFLANASDGWAMATASVRDLFAEADLHADEVGGDFAGESERLGQATAEVHLLMGRSLEARTVGPRDSQATAQQLVERLDAALAVVPQLAPYADALRQTYAEVGERTEPVGVQRVHGDYHLGQVMRTQEGWVLLDFEGEPARTLVERTALMSPLRDVAGMLRSFDYAARHLLAERGTDAQLAYRATEWAERNREAFCDGYARAAGSDPRDERTLLRAFELDKAVYEAVYEANNRPSWLPIPLGSIERLVTGAA